MGSMRFLMREQSGDAAFKVKQKFLILSIQLETSVISSLSNVIVYLIQNVMVGEVQDFFSSFCKYLLSTFDALPRTLGT